MIASQAWLVRLATCAAIVIQSQLAVAQFRLVNFEVDQLPQPGGGITYRLFTAQTRASGILSSGTFLTSPNGLVFPSVTNTMDFNSFADLGTALFGDWLATENPSSGPDNTYTLRIAPFTLADVFSESPVISSPLSGSTVGLDFVVNWGYPSGATPSSKGFSYSSDPILVVDQGPFGEDGMYSASFHTQLLRPGPADFLGRANTQTHRPDPQVLNRSSALIGQLISTSFFFNSKSLEVTYHVIPEPSGVSALLLGLACFNLTRRRS